MSDRSDRNPEELPGIQVISRAADIMRALSEKPQGMSLSAIAQEVSLPRSTVQRIVAALELERLVEFLGPSGGFRLGPALGQLIHKTQSDIISSIRPILASLSAEIRETVSLGTLAADKVYIVDCITYERELRVVVPIGIQVPAYLTAIGRSLLQALPEDRLASILPAKLRTPSGTLLGRPEFIAALHRSRPGGVLVDNEEYLEGVRTYAILIRTHFGNYAVSVLAPTRRAIDQAEVLKDGLIGCRDAIEARVGVASR
jgi:DNA-binding IclR family transcriptional regulator